MELDESLDELVESEPRSSDRAWPWLCSFPSADSMLLNSVVIVRWNPAQKRVVAVSDYGGQPLASSAADPK